MTSMPVVTIDGPSGAGKGTISKLLAKKLGWHLLDSGAIYRVLAVASIHHQIEPEDEEGLVPLASSLDVNFIPDGDVMSVVLEGEDVSTTIREEQIGELASKIAPLPRVREALLRRQRAFRQEPGLVADGRDMGTIVFPKALIKIFLTASAEQRARRRFEQLKGMGKDVNIDRLLSDIKQRDERDSNRSVAPLVPAEGAFVIDSSELSINEVYESALNLVEDKIKI